MIGPLLILLAWTTAAPGTPRTGAEQARVYTSTRCVTAITVGPDGTVWVGTTGGVLWRGPDGAWRKFTMAEGLPAHEVRRLAQEEGGIVAVFPTASAAWSGTGWRAAPPRPVADGTTVPGQTCSAVWRGEPVVATVTGLRIGQGDRPREVALPPSPGTHVSALLPRGDTLWVAMYGDGLWAWNGSNWRRVGPALPPAAREVTALAASGPSLWVGTRREGAWEWDGSCWTQHLQPHEPYDHNVQSLAFHDGALYAGTLEDGLVVRETGGWRHIAPPSISSVAPRQMVSFGQTLYARHGDGQVDRLGAGEWARGVCAGLLRREVNALWVDGRRLYTAQWGGWSEFDGGRWVSHLTAPGLQGVQTTAICRAGQSVWLGTQKRGIAEIDVRTGAVTWHDLRRGLVDDWVTCVWAEGGAVWAGTFVGGLARLRDGRWSTVPGTEGANVTAIVADGLGGVYAATRTGVWRVASDGSRADPVLVGPSGSAEAQALCLTREGLWVGTRTGLWLVPRSR